MGPQPFCFSPLGPSSCEVTVTPSCCLHTICSAPNSRQTQLRGHLVNITEHLPAKEPDISGSGEFVETKNQEIIVDLAGEQKHNFKLKLMLPQAFHII